MICGLAHLDVADIRQVKNIFGLRLKLFARPVARDRFTKASTIAAVDPLISADRLLQHRADSRSRAASMSGAA